MSEPAGRQVAGLAMQRVGPGLRGHPDSQNPDRGRLLPDVLKFNVRHAYSRQAPLALEKRQS